VAHCLSAVYSKIVKELLPSLCQAKSPVWLAYKMLVDSLIFGLPCEQVFFPVTQYLVAKQSMWTNRLTAVKELFNIMDFKLSLKKFRAGGDVHKQVGILYIQFQGLKCVFLFFIEPTNWETDLRWHKIYFQLVLQFTEWSSSVMNLHLKVFFLEILSFKTQIVAHPLMSSNYMDILLIAANSHQT